MNDRRKELVDKMEIEGWKWVRKLSTSAYYRYCYDRRFNLVKPPEKKIEKLVFITEEQFKHYEIGKRYVHKRRKQS